MSITTPKAAENTSTGIVELDNVLGGGLAQNRLYLIEGDPGTGKTTIGLQFLLEGVRLGEPTLYVTLSETKDELIAVAESHGWSCDAIDIYELIDPSEELDSESQYTMFEPSEIELSQTVRRVLAEVERIKPRRVVFDSLSEMRLLAQSPLRYRRQILALKQFFVGRDCTVILLDDMTASNDQQLQSIAHGVIRLEHLLGEFGGERRRLRVMKYRGREFQGGTHDMRLVRGGVQLFPRKSDQVEQVKRKKTLQTSGNTALDTLLGNGLPAGSSTLLLGPAGVGKSSCGTLYALSAAQRGERAILFLFEESTESLITRSLGLGMDLQPHIDAGRIEIYQLDAGELSPGEFSHNVRAAVKGEEGQALATVVMIDSINGYLNSMPHERFLVVQMRELLKQLGEMQVVTFLVVAQHGMLGQSVGSPVDASYLTDNVILFRYFEAQGEIRKAISVVKKRSGGHENTIREYSMAKGQILVGEPLREFQGVLTGVPKYQGDQANLSRSNQ